MSRLSASKHVAASLRRRSCGTAAATAAASPSPSAAASLSRSGRAASSSSWAGLPAEQCTESHLSETRVPAIAVGSAPLVSSPSPRSDLQCPGEATLPTPYTARRTLSSTSGSSTGSSALLQAFVRACSLQSERASVLVEKERPGVRPSQVTADAGASEDFRAGLWQRNSRSIPGFVTPMAATSHPACAATLPAGTGSLVYFGHVRGGHSRRNPIRVFGRVR
jgi:hypothetical protein